MKAKVGFKIKDRFYIGKWDRQEKKFIWFEYIESDCGCWFLTVLNILFMYRTKDCKW